MTRLTHADGTILFTQMYPMHVWGLPKGGSVVVLDRIHHYVQESPEVVLARFKMRYSPSFPYTPSSLDSCYE